MEKVNTQFQINGPYFSSYDALGYDTTNQTAYLDSMLRWGLDWLIKVIFE